MKKWIITLSFLFVVLLCANVSGATVDDNVYNALAPCYSENLIASYGPVPVFDEDSKLKSAGISTLFTDNDTFQKEWYQNIHQLYENTKYEIDKKYSYPRGPVISYGTDALGSVIIGIYEKEKTDSAFRDKIYSTIKSEADILDIDDLPVIFFTAPMPELQASRSDSWRPVIGGIQGTSSVGAFTLGFAATGNGQNGFVTTGHVGGTGTTIYQPGSPNSVGTITVSSGGATSDSSFVQYSNVAAKIFESSLSQPSVYSYSDPWENLWVIKSGIGTGTTVGQVISETSLWNSYFGVTLYNQWYASYSSTGGDSGGPVYYKDTNHRIYISGIHWAMGSYSCFSPISSVMNDLGISVKT